MKDRLEIFKRLGVVPKGLLVNEINFDFKTRRLTVELLYDPEQQLEFRMILEDCRKIQWERMNEDEDFDQADVIGIHLGEDNYNLPTLIHTREFEITVEQGRILIEKSWD